MPTRREDTLWPVVHQRSMHLRALLDSLPVDVLVEYELDYYPYAQISLALLLPDAPPRVVSTGWAHANRQWEYHSEFTLRVVEEAIRLVEAYRADPTVSGWFDSTD